MTGNAGHIMNLANSIIGVGLLAMPFCFKQCGITLAIIMLMLSSMISRVACYFLVRSSTMCRRRNFEYLAFYTFGPSGKLLVELGIIGFMMGTCVAFFVVMGDLGPAIVSKIFNVNNNSTLRTSVLIGIGFFVILPLGLLRNIESLMSISTATIGFYFLFILKIFFESSQHLIAGDWWHHVNFWNPEGILQCIPIFAMSLSCQTQLFEIYDSLPVPSVEKMNYVVHSALNLCTAVYASVGLLGYIAYCKGTFSGNILLSFTPSLSSEMFKLGFVMSIAVSFPLVIFPCRASLYSLMFRRMPIHHEAGQTSSHIPDSRFKWLTIAIVVVSLVTGLLIPSIELVLGFVGSTIGIAVCVIFPSLSFLNLNTKDTSEQTIAKITVVIGFIIMIVGTFGNLFAAVDHKSLETTTKLLNFNSLSHINSFDVKTEGVAIIKTISQEKSLERIKPLNSAPVITVEKIKNENQRKEPPVPVPPGLKLKDNKKFVKSVDQVKIKNELNAEKLKKEQKKIITASKEKLNDNINKDAIEKENREIMEMEREEKAKDDKKEKDLLKILKEHEDEQKKLIQEQKKILNEIKSQQKLNDALKQKSYMNLGDSEISVPKRDTLKNMVPVKKLNVEHFSRNDSVKFQTKASKIPAISLKSMKESNSSKAKNDPSNHKIRSRSINNNLSDEKSNSEKSTLIENNEDIKLNKKECSERSKYNATETRQNNVKNQSFALDSEKIVKNLTKISNQVNLDLTKNLGHLEVNINDKKEEDFEMKNTKLAESVIRSPSVLAKKRDLKSVEVVVD